MMDASDFVKNYIRMCSAVGDCEQCPCGETNFCTAPSNLRSLDGADEVVHIVEEWAAAHPPKTRQSAFLELFPEADVCETDDCRTCLTLDPCHFYPKMRKDCSLRKCSDCRKAFWLSELD